MIIFSIAQRELRNMFNSLLAWIVLSGISLIVFLILITLVKSYLDNPSNNLGGIGVTGTIVSTVFYFCSYLFILIAPMLTMRSFSGEFKNKTSQLLFSAPISMTEIVLGKCLGLYLFGLITAVIPLLITLSLVFGTQLDAGLYFSSLLGFLLVTFTFMTIGVFASSLTEHIGLSAFSSIGIILFLFWLVELVASLIKVEALQSALQYLSISKHASPFYNGQINSSDLIFFILTIATFIVLTIRKLDSYRMQH